MSRYRECKTGIYVHDGGGGKGRRDGREGRARPSVFSLRPVASYSGKAILDEREPPKTLLPESHITT